MSNEEKILQMLSEMQSNIKSLQTEVESLKNSTDNPKPLSPAAQLAIIEAMSNLLTDEDRDALGKYQEEEEARKAALYG